MDIDISSNRIFLSIFSRYVVLAADTLEQISTYETVVSPIKFSNGSNIYFYESGYLVEDPSNQKRYNIDLAYYNPIWPYFKKPS